MSNDVLISVPLFLFMGYMVERANILDRLFLSLQVGLRGLPGSMALARLITCALLQLLQVLWELCYSDGFIGPSRNVESWL